MNSGEKLNGTDHWSEAIAWAWSNQWLKAEVAQDPYLWTILTLELFHGAIRMGCETQMWLAEIAEQRAIELGSDLILPIVPVPITWALSSVYATRRVK